MKRITILAGFTTALLILAGIPASAIGPRGGGGFKGGGGAKPAGGFSKPAGGFSKPAGGFSKPAGGISHTPSISQPISKPSYVTGGGINKPSLPSGGAKLPSYGGGGISKPNLPSIQPGGGASKYPGISTGGGGKLPSGIGDGKFIVPGGPGGGTKLPGGIGDGKLPGGGGKLPGGIGDGKLPGGGGKLPGGIGDGKLPGGGGKLPGGIGDGKFPGIDHKPSKDDLGKFLNLGPDAGKFPGTKDIGKGDQFFQNLQDKKGTIGDKIGDIGGGTKIGDIGGGTKIGDKIGDIGGGTKIGDKIKGGDKNINFQPNITKNQQINIDNRHQYATSVRKNFNNFNNINNFHAHDWFHGNWWNRYPHLNNCPFHYYCRHNALARGYWWRWATWPALLTFAPIGWGQPVYYDYGYNLVYEDNSVYYNGQQVATVPEYTEQAAAIADVGVKQLAAVAAAPEQKEMEWMPLGVFAAVQQHKTDEATMYLQLAVSKDGVLSGTFYDTTSEKSQVIQGAVDKKSQRAAWTIGDKKDMVIETGIYNLTQDETPVLVHFGSEKTQTWMLVRLEEPKEKEAGAGG